MSFSRISSRKIIQFIFFVFVIFSISSRNLMAAFLPQMPELQGICPFGAVQTLFQGITDLESLIHPNRSRLWILIGGIGTALLFGAVFCSYLCPLGTFQEWISRLHRRWSPRSYNKAPPRILNILAGSLKYLMLLLLFLSTSGLLALSVDAFNPSYALGHLWTSGVPLTAIAVLLITTILSWFYNRPWCRWACPYGLILSTLGKVSLIKIRRSVSSCINCKKCDRTCPVQIPVYSREIITDSRCNRCRECINVCPVSGALHNTLPLQPALFAILIPLTFLAPLGTAWAAGAYTPSIRNIPETLQLQQEQQHVTIDDISPVHTLSDLALLLGIEYDSLTELLGLPGYIASDTMLIDIEDDPEYRHVTFGFIRDTIQDHLLQEEN